MRGLSLLASVVIMAAVCIASVALWQLHIAGTAGIRVLTMEENAQEFASNRGTCTLCSGLDPPYK